MIWQSKNAGSLSGGLLALLLLLTMLPGCLSEISLEVPANDQQQLVIRGVLKDLDTAVVSVSLSYLTDFSSEATPNFVNGAIVSLIDESGNQLSVPMVNAGRYELTILENTNSLEVKPGQAYQLSVLLPDGRQYESSLETLYEVPEPQSVDYLTEQRVIVNEAGNLIDQEFLKFLITTPIVNAQGGRSFLKWSFIGTYKFMETAEVSPFPPNVRTCYIHENLDLEHVVAYNGEENSQDVLSGYFLLEEPFNYRFVDGFYLSVYQQSLSEKAYEYWDAIGKIVALSGNFFDAPPGKVRGNFHNIIDESEEVFGYFYATQEAILRYYIPPARGEVEAFCPATGTRDWVQHVCFDCLSRGGSTLEKPDFWEN